MENLQFNIEKIKNISLEEKKSRKESLNIFNKEGFPNKRLEEWKFTDFNKIINDNFNDLSSFQQVKNLDTIDELKDFEHNSIILINGVFQSSRLNFENQKKIEIKKYTHRLIKKATTSNSLINLNDALFEGGFSLEILNNYKFNKPVIIYNYFNDSIKNQLINNRNLIILNDNCNLELVELNSDVSKNNFVQNNYTSIEVGENSTLKNYTVQGCTSNGFFYKFVKACLKKDSNYSDNIFSSGLKFNKIEQEVDVVGEESNCSIQSALYLRSNNHQEIKTQINHLKPNSKSYQKIKNVLSDNCKSAYQGKIYVKDIAQKTDAYQLSRALLLSDYSEFNAKPELEIYADDVKCSHGSTSGSVNEDSIYYLMTRGISRKNAIQMLTKAFMLEITESILNTDIRKFVEKNLDRQIYGY